MGLLGAGVIGRALAAQLAAGAVAGCTAGPVVTRSTGDPADLLACDVVVECAGVGSVGAVPALLAAGTDVVLCSCAALADHRVRAALDAVPAGAARLVVPAGAVGGLDLFRAAVRGSDDAVVELHTTKRAAAVGGGGGGPATVFTGSAREAALAFPRTANVAVALALATTGLEATRVRVTGDPAATSTRHVLRCRSSLGEAVLDVTNTVAEGSGGRTSAVTAWSVVTVLEDLASGLASGIRVPWGRGTAGAVGPPGAGPGVVTRS
ncbi:aspartate dehydrogenase domain-containing protein [Klenkia brasiliensis]|uniref:aspartate dehydrogenase domain-containing protein n=1 Tax=Klenkia brasiliensis TaxID=333142 RepID=UPI0013F5B8E2|nr:aspartate dehydrogenase domain-containing protein [Klenkia brasiliensis]